MSPAIPSSPSLKLRSLPVIDIAPWVHPEDEHYRGHNGGRWSTAAALHAACLTYGFFYLDISSYVDPQEMGDLATLAKQFFALPEEEKQKLGLEHQDGARGYQRLKENVTNGKADNHEGLDFYAPVAEPDKRKPLWGENQWPSNDMVLGFRSKYERWVEKMKALGMIVMQAMSVGLGMTDEEWEDLKSKVDDSFWVMRVIGYPPLPNDYDGYSCGAHKDYGCLTFLYADPTPNALQVFLPQPELRDDAATSPILASAAANLAPSAASEHFVEPNAPVAPGLASEPGSKTIPEDSDSEDGVWINADPLPGCVVCNIGEMWEIWTNGLYKSTLHRVIHRGSNYRVSIPFFFEPNYTARVAPLAAALRLQEDSIQPAYAYVPHTPPIPYPHCHIDGTHSAAPSRSTTLGAAATEIINSERESESLAQRLEALIASSSSGSSSSSGASEGAESATTATTSPRQSFDAGPTGTGAREEVKKPQPPLSAVNAKTAPGVFNPLEPTHAHSVSTPMSVSQRYQPVVYGEFLMKKVGNNFATGKGKYD